jgi:hypothetical protein
MEVRGEIAVALAGVGGFVEAYDGGLAGSVLEGDNVAAEGAVPDVAIREKIAGRAEEHFVFLFADAEFGQGGL